jgi:hypothetical protein
VEPVPDPSLAENLAERIAHHQVILTGAILGNHDQILIPGGVHEPQELFVKTWSKIHVFKERNDDDADASQRGFSRIF